MAPRRHAGVLVPLIGVIDRSTSTPLRHLQLEMHALAERLSARFEQRPSAAPTTLDNPDALSQREIEVLRLLATGKSNREIADTLYISLSTVASHVRHILTKTGCTNRTEAAAYALRCGLTEH